jgi:homoserine dehydrogenase
MKRVQLLQLGNGNVGKAFIEAVKNLEKQHPEPLIEWIGLLDSKSPSIRWEEQAMSIEPDVYSPFENPDYKGQISRILLDLTASGSTSKDLLQAHRYGWGLILANKKPLVESQNQFDTLMSGKIGFRATVGAGLPVIPEIQKLIKDGHQIVKLEACLSGTLGVVFSALQNGQTFSKIVQEVVQLGFTEPNPRLDLAGSDVLRKILILTRLSGYPVEMSEVRAEKLYPEPMEELNLEDFLDHLSFLDPIMKSRIENAHSGGKVLRYIATQIKGSVSVGIQAVSKDSPLGLLKNDEKRILIYTNKLKDPVVITGAGSGAQDTAKDLVQDLLQMWP